jgi:hypothetical protein
MLPNFHIRNPLVLATNRPLSGLLTAGLFLGAAAAWAQPAPFEFHGLRMAMRQDAIAAAGYRFAHFVDTTISAQGYEVTSGLPPALGGLKLFLYNHALFQIDATFPPLRGDAALTLIRDLRARYGAPEGGFDPLRDDRWAWQGMTFHYSPGIRDDGTLRVNLLITDEAVYRKALHLRHYPPPNLTH